MILAFIAIEILTIFIAYQLWKAQKKYTDYWYKEYKKISNKLFNVLKDS